MYSIHNKKIKTMVNNQPKLDILSKLVMEQITGTTTESGDSSDFCTVNVSSEVNQNFPSENTQLIKTIQDSAKSQLLSSSLTYKNWYNKPETQNKIKNKSLLNKLPTFLDNISKKPINFYKNPLTSPKPKVIAWVTTPKDKASAKKLGNKWGVINMNMFNIHNGTNFIHSLFDVIHHEMGHLIDSYFKINGENIYKTTHPEYNQDEYEKNYIVNDKDQFSRLSVLRTTIGAGPLDDAKTMLDKFLQAVKSGKITSNYFNFSSAKGSYDPKIFSKNSTEVAKSINSYLLNRIMINGTVSGNIEQLFSTFSFAKKESKTIYVNFNLLSDLNRTTAKLDSQNQETTLTERIMKKSKLLLEIENTETFYFLALTPKSGNLTPSSNTTPSTVITPPKPNSNPQNQNTPTRPLGIDDGPAVFYNT